MKKIIKITKIKKKIKTKITMDYLRKKPNK